MSAKPIVSARVKKVRGQAAEITDDALAVEEPLEIQVSHLRGGTRVKRPISVTMRTPGHDEELAAGFLLTEGIIQSRSDIAGFSNPAAEDARPGSEDNRLCVNLADAVAFDPARLERNFYTTSSCGVCGKASLEALRLQGCPTLPKVTPRVRSSLLHGLPGMLRARQAVFDNTGALHAAALFDSEGEIVESREDVGRHNAVDKLVGRMLLQDGLPLSEYVMLVSGRTSFEIMQKALAAGIAFVAAVGAPSSLAVEVANVYNMTLVGFLRDNRFNVYSAAQRIM